MPLDRLPRRPLPPAPVAPVHPHRFEVHGQTIEDPYAWLKAANWREVLKDPALLSPEIRAHLEAENAYLEAALAGTEPLREALVKEMRGRIKEDDASVPQADGPFAYYTRYREGGQHPLVCREPREGGTESVLLDGDREAEGHPFFDLGDASHSPDHRLMAWSADVKGSEYFTIRLRDLASGADLQDTVPNTGGSIVWASDNSAFYYVELDENHRPVRVRRHRLGTSAGEDEIVYEETDPGFFVNIGSTQSDAYVVISASDHETSECWLLDRADPAAKPVCIEPRTPQLQYSVEHHGDRLILLTNADGAEDFKLMTVPVAAPGRANWRDLVPHRPGIMILSHLALARYLVRLERKDANPQVIVRAWETGEEHAIAFPEEAYSLGFDAGYEFDTDVIRYRYSSLTTPTETVDYDIRTGERRLRKRQEVPSGHDPADYVTRRLFATAPDGEEVPISLVHRRDFAHDGSAPCLLYGYGSYGMSMP
ncbi:MAG: S9 family peptidase, partial [Pseudomonadota bacterium]|nr:S9 family peptidase [Pseudomonadota bacterium]